MVPIVEEVAVAAVLVAIDGRKIIKKTRLVPSHSEGRSRCCPYPVESDTFYQDKKRSLHRLLFFSHLRRF